MTENQIDEFKYNTVFFIYFNSLIYQLYFEGPYNSQFGIQMAVPSKQDRNVFIKIVSQLTQVCFFF